MLVLSRKLHEAIQIGPDVEIEVVRIRAGTVWLGITAPRNINVARTEVYDPAKANQEVDDANVG